MYDASFQESTETGVDVNLSAGVINAVLALLLGAAVLVMIRLWRGPTISDRALALDLLGFVAIGFVSIVAVRTGASALFDAAMALALIAFLATIALARYAEAVDGDKPNG